MSHRVGLGAEHPLNDKVQAVFFVVFLGVWVLDSFVLHFSTVLADLVSIWIRLPLGGVSFAIGVYLVAKSEAAVFGRTLVGRNGKPKLITTGVYSWVRHPMYLGILLVFLGFVFATLSLLSLLIWACFFVFFNKMATYEEQDLCKTVAEQYGNYQKKVPKWFPHLRREPGTKSKTLIQQ
jgi:protein-S-isoprenylcysteine O-methyltransferase Ste14